MTGNERGFTLMEVTVVLAVITILLGVVVMGSGYAFEQREEIAEDTLNEEGNTALITYYSLYGRFPFGVCVNADGTEAVSVGETVVLTEEQNEKLMEELSGVTGQKMIEGYSSEDYEITVTYSSEYVAGMTFRKK